MSSDRIALRGLRAWGRHGALAAERDLGQEFVIDVELFLNTGPAASSDDLTKTVDYGALAARLVARVRDEPVNLIETLAEELAGICLSERLVERTAVTVHKPSAPIPHPFDDVAVTIQRSRP